MSEDMFAQVMGAMDQMTATTRDVMPHLAKVREQAMDAGFTRDAAEQMAMDVWATLLNGAGQ